MKKFNFKRKWIFITLFSLIFISGIIINLPAWILSNTIKHYSDGKLRLYNEKGSLWHGSGLLVIENARLKVSAPLILLNWDVSLGINNFVNIDFSIDQTHIGQIYLNKNGLNISQLSLSLSIDQVSKFVSIVSTFGLSGNLQLSTNHSTINSKGTGEGVITAQINNISSNMSPLNPLGTYTVKLNLTSGLIDVSSEADSIVNIHGSGNFDNLILNAHIRQDKQKDMSQFMMTMGNPNPDGGYSLKIN